MKYGLFGNWSKQTVTRHTGDTGFVFRLHCLQTSLWYPVTGIANSSFSVQGSLFRRIDTLLGEFRVGGGVHDSYTFQCGLVGSFTSLGI